MKIGSKAHKELFCESFMASHLPYEPEKLYWPKLDCIDLERLQKIPFWTEAIRIEQQAGMMVSTYAETVSDPLIRQALALQGREEARHAQLIKFMTQLYGIQAHVPPLAPLPQRLELAFIEFGYRECLDSFLAFGLFDLTRQSNFVPESFLRIFNAVLDEEARHILFFVNWIAYQRAIQQQGSVPLQAILTFWNYTKAIKNQLMMLNQAKSHGNGAGFTVSGANSVSVNFSIKKFLLACIQENQRRLSVFDQRLLRPQFLPTLGSVGLRLSWLLP